MQTADMLRMANQIAQFFKPYPRDEGAKEVATHINNYWGVEMRRKLFQHLAKGGQGLELLVVEAAGQIRKPQEPPSEAQTPLPPPGAEDG